ncbi:MAG TPA: response regulator transcription factor [Xanthobacteraceae bacterium]|nr:response regulator transcription factor [Xanthobacteraceae bacterium]
MTKSQSVAPRLLIAHEYDVPAIPLDLAEADFEIIGTVRDCQSLICAVLDLGPDVALIDISLAIHDGFRAAKEIIRLRPNTKLVFHTRNAETVLAEEAFAVGASGFVIWGRSDLTRALRFALNGKGNGSSAERQCLNGTLSPGQTAESELTHREQEVLALLAGGHSMKTIAYRLGITYRTVTFHKYRMMHRLGITTNAGLVNYALMRGIREGLPGSQVSL